MDKMRILAISGSLRANSANTCVLQAAKILAPTSLDIVVYSELSQLPHFNPDLDRQPLPNFITSLHQQIKNSDGVIISSPEYAHGVPGSLKNALDWLVSSVEFPGKPVALINTNPRATIAQTALKEILVTMSAEIAESSCVELEIAGKGLNTQEIVDHPQLSMVLKQAISNFAKTISASR